MEDHRSRIAADQARAILQTSLDCIISMDGRGRLVEFNPAAERTFGHRRADVIGRELAEIMIPEPDREAHRRGLARYIATGEGPVLGRRIELMALRADGTLFPVELAITRVPGEGPPLFTAYLRDISDRVHTERLRTVRLAATQCLTAASDARTGVCGVLRAVCENLGWEIAFFWAVDARDDTLMCLESWSSDPAPWSTFIAASHAQAFRRGEGLPGRVWVAATSQWIPDVTIDRNFARAGAAARSNVRSALGCPVMAGARMIGVIEFFTRQTREPDADLLETMGTVAAHLGQFIERTRVEEAVRESEARFRNLMEQAPFSVQILAPDGSTLRVNQAWRELWGVSLEAIGDYNVLADPQLAEKGVLPYLRRAFDGEAVMLPAIAYDPHETIPGVGRREDALRWVSAVAYPLKDEGGRVREVVLVHQDITARTRAEQAVRGSEEKLRLLADTIPQLAWMARPDGHIFWYNRRWYEYTGTTPEQMEGWGWQSVHDPAVLPSVLERWNASLTRGDPFDMVFPLRGADGRYRPFLTRVNPLRDARGAIECWFGTNTDISEIKRMEEQLREADRRKDEFLATLAHELRNPLAPLRSGLDLLKMKAGPEAVIGTVREIMDRQVSHLVRLVDDLLELSRISRGTFELRKGPVEVRAIVEAAIETSDPIIKGAGHVFQVLHADEPLVVVGDALRLAQVIANILNNAATYTPPGGAITLETGRDGADVVIAIADTGDGIEAEELPRLFQMFSRVQRTSRTHQAGLGIGLALVRSLVEMHGGSVQAQSEGRGRGSRFSVRLPLAPLEVGSRKIERPAVDGIEGLRVLVVDDNRDAAATLSMLLDTLGVRVRAVHDGPSAVRAYPEFRPDAVLLDIGMPGMDGYEVARALRAIDEHAFLVAVTGWGQDQDRTRAREAGFDHHLVKPAETDLLVSLLDSVKRRGAALLRRQ